MSAPCSWQQKECFDWERRNPAVPAQIVQFVLFLPSRITRGDVEKAASRVAADHEMLRSSFSFDTSADLVRVHDEVDVQLVDVGDVDQADELVARTKVVPDRTRAPQWSLAVGRTPDALCMLVTVDHLVFDGVSLKVFLDDFTAALVGVERHRRRRSAGYLEYCEWQRQREGSMVWEQDREFWRRYLEAPHGTGSTASADAQCRPSGQQVMATTIPKLGGRLLPQVTARSLTAFRASLGLVAVALARVSGVHDLEIMVARSGRPREFLRTIGWFANVLPFRIWVGHGMTFSDLFAQIGETDTLLNRHQNVPAGLVSGARPSGLSASDGVGSVLVDFPDSPAPLARLDGTVDILGVTTVNRHLDFKVRNAKDRVHIDCHYNDAVHPPEEMHALREQLQVLTSGDQVAGDHLVLDEDGGGR